MEEVKSAIEMLEKFSLSSDFGERISLRIVYYNQSSTFEELLERDRTFSIHHKNIQSLAFETYKFVNGFPPEIMTSVFHLKENRYSMRNVVEGQLTTRKITPEDNFPRAKLPLAKLTLTIRFHLKIAPTQANSPQRLLQIS